MRGLVVFGIHLIGETVFWLKSLYQLGFVRFFGFYFWIGAIEFEAIDNNIRLHLKPKMPLISADEPLPPREDMYEYFAPDNRLAKIRRQIDHCAIL
jgi:hypothetical protein